MRRTLVLTALSISISISCADRPRATPTLTAAAATPAPSLEAETREILDQLIAVDTSHGGETAALTPLVERFARAGVRAELVESAPGRGNLVARVKGNGQKRPLLLLAHVDVVPVEGQSWSVPAFAATEREGFLWGRGSSDDKAMAAANAAILLELARTKGNLSLSRDVIVALTAGEETGGGAGVRWLVDHRRDLIDAELALNEGGGFQTTKDLSRVEVVTFGAAQKIFQSFRLRVAGRGGHSSVPPTDFDPVATLSRALVRVADYRFPAKVLPSVKPYLAFQASTEPPGMAEALKRAAASAPRLAPEDEAVLSQDRIYNALVRTTCVTTMLSASPQDNVLPTNVEAIVNCRILPDETREDTRAALARTIDDGRVSIEPAQDNGYGPSPPLDGVVPRAIAKVSAAMWPGAPVIPSMGTGANDSRFLLALGVQAYGVDAAPSSIYEAKTHGGHGADERIPLRWLGEGARFLRALTLELAK